MTRVPKILIVILLLALPAQLSASWQRGRLFGADVRALVVDPKNPDVLYLGTSSGEVYISRDGAKSWSNPYLGVPFQSYIVDNLAVDQKGRLWAASWGLWGGSVVAVSSDGGATWSRRDAGLEEASVRALALDPSDPNTLVAGGLTGVWKSHDGGRKWEQISKQENVESLAIDPRDARTIYVGTWRQAWRTDDDGATWKHIANGMVLDTDVFTIRIDPKNPDSVWASTCGWVYNSPDRGDTWTRFKEGFNNRRIHDITVDPRNANFVFAGSVAGLYRTEDAGKTWKIASDESLVINSIVLHADRHGRIILGTEGDGVYISSDSGKTFARSNEGLYNVRVASVVPDPEKKGTVYASVLFGGNSSGVYRSNDYGSSWERLSRTRLPEVLTLLVQEKGSTPRFLAGTERGLFWSADGQEWNPSEPSTTPLRYSEIIRYNQTRLFAASSAGVMTSKDGGKNWYLLGGMVERTVDIAVGRFAGARALFALTSSGVMLFDGSKWSAIAGSPAKGRALAISPREDANIVFVSGVQGMSAGKVGDDLKWKSSAVPEEAIGSFFQARGSRNNDLFYAPRNDRFFFIGERAESGWKKLPLPVAANDVLTLGADPFSEKNLYLGTHGHGFFFFRPASDAKPTVPAGYAAGGAK